MRIEINFTVILRKDYEKRLTKAERTGKILPAKKWLWNFTMRDYLELSYYKSPEEMLRILEEMHRRRLIRNVRIEQIKFCTYD
jgi:hypothetical protein